MLFNFCGRVCVFVCVFEYVRRVAWMLQELCEFVHLFPTRFVIVRA